MNWLDKIRQEGWLLPNCKWKVHNDKHNVTCCSKVGSGFCHWPCSKRCKHPEEEYGNH